MTGKSKIREPIIQNFVRSFPSDFTFFRLFEGAPLSVGHAQVIKYPEYPSDPSLKVSATESKSTCFILPKSRICDFQRYHRIFLARFQGNSIDRTAASERPKIFGRVRQTTVQINCPLIYKLHRYYNVERPPYSVVWPNHELSNPTTQRIWLIWSWSIVFHCFAVFVISRRLWCSKNNWETADMPPKATEERLKAVYLLPLKQTLQTRIME